MDIAPIQGKAHTTIIAVHEGLKKAFASVKEELDEHRDAINDNTNELHANYEYTVALENKIDRLSERIDELQLMFSQLVKESHKIMLADEEQKVFLHLYTQDDFVNTQDLAVTLTLPHHSVEEALHSMTSKGINLITAYRDKTGYVRLDPHFKEEQAKHHIVMMRPTL